MRWIAGLLVVVVLATAGLFVVASRSVPPELSVTKPGRFVGQESPLEVAVVTDDGKLSALTVTVEQHGRSTLLFSLDNPASGAVAQTDRTHMVVTRPFGKRNVPELQAGAARIVVHASRTTFLGLKTLSSTAIKDVEVRLEPPRIAVLSTHHYVNHGGSEMVVYRATPADVRSGVRVGEVEYPGYAAADAATAGADPSIHIAFFALLHDQDLNTPIVAFARDDAGNEMKTSFIDKVFEKPFRRSRIELDDRFISRVVPEILEHSPELKAPAAGLDLIPAFLAINRDLRRMNAEAIAAMARSSAPRRLWSGPFVQLGNSKVEAGFADHRTYLYKGQEIDQQVHLGFDLAVTSHVPVVAANDGTVVHASWLGIYGNCVVLDHGMGVQSLYGHLSSIDVKPGDTVTRGQTIGRTGMTGMAGGDHLHFTMLVGGHMVSPVDWWDPHWISDRVDRKRSEAR